jgi:myotubularin-related protein 1/2
LAYRTRPTRLWDLYAFSDAYPTGGDPRQRLRAEYIRLISGDTHAFQNTIEQPQRGSAWRLCEVNANYNVCPTYPSLMVVPTSIRYFGKLLLLEASMWLAVACLKLRSVKTG